MTFKFSIVRQAAKYVLQFEDLEESFDTVMLLNKDQLVTIMQTISKELNYDIKPHFDNIVNYNYEHMPYVEEPHMKNLFTGDKLTDDDRKKLDDIIKKSDEFDKMIKSSEDILRNVTSNFQPSRLFYVEVDAFQKYMNEIDERFKELETRVTNIEIKREEEEDNGKSNKEEG